MMINYFRFELNYEKKAEDYHEGKPKITRRLKANSQSHNRQNTREIDVS